MLKNFLQLKKEKKIKHFILLTNKNIYYSFHFKWQLAKDELSKLWWTLFLSVLAMISKLLGIRFVPFSSYRIFPISC